MAEDGDPKRTLARIVGARAATAATVLAGVTVPAAEITELDSLHESLETRLAHAYWSRAGIIPFARNDVPYLVNNNGRASERAAAVVHAAFEERGTNLPQRLVLMELGAGTGLHARYFLDAFADLCRESGTDFYERLTFVVSDRYERTVREWHETGMFEDHAGHVALAVCDASMPSQPAVLDGSGAPIEGRPLVVFCNYLLDVLPARIVRRGAAGLEELHVRTHLAGGDVALKIAGIASLDEARGLAASGRDEDLERLLPLLGQLELETAFRPWTPEPGPGAALAAAFAAGAGAAVGGTAVGGTAVAGEAGTGEATAGASATGTAAGLGPPRAVVNDGALLCLEKIFEFIDPAGFVLVNDYGPVRLEDVPNHVGVHRFGGSVALGVNFPLLEKVLAARGLTVLAPDGDENRRIHTRLVGRSIGDRTAEVLRTRFRHELDRFRDEPLEEARQHVAAGRANEAIAAYRTALERNPRDWQMTGEAAEYVGLQLKDYGAGLQIARAALERNPWCSAWLWNVLGDCLFCTEKYDEAHEAYLQAERIDADDPRTNLNLGYTHAVQGRFDEALAVLARGLAQDARTNSAYRTRLLDKQAQVLAVLSERASAERDRLVRRAERFR